MKFVLLLQLYFSSKNFSATNYISANALDVLTKIPIAVVFVIIDLPTIFHIMACYTLWKSSTTKLHMHSSNGS
jgi:hypothetical protein